MPLPAEQADARAELLTKLLASARQLNLLAEALSYAESLAEVSPCPVKERLSAPNRGLRAASKPARCRQTLLLKALRYAPAISIF